MTELNAWKNMELGQSVATGGFGGLSPPNKALIPPKLQRETL